MDVKDADELCRQLLASPSGWGSSTRHMEAVDLLGKLRGPGELPAAFVALLLCSCRRWDRVTTRLIAAIEASGVLCDSDLDELAESLLSHELVISYPLTWISPQWLDIDLSDGTSRTYTVDEDALGQHRLSFEPPLRRWAARRALRADPTRLDDLLSAAEGFRPRHRDAIHGLLDAADVLDEAQRRGVVRRGLQTAQASVRRTALDRLCELDGPQKWSAGRGPIPTRRCASGDPRARRAPASSRHDEPREPDRTRTGSGTRSARLMSGQSHGGGR